MRCFTRHARIVTGICVLAVVVGVAQSNKPGQKWAPQFPREGATKLFENEHVIIWEQIGRPKESFMHKHLYDIITIGLEPGGGISVVNADGSKSGGSGLTQSIYNKAPHTASYSKAGIGPHAELMNDAKNPGKSIFIELKATKLKDCAQWSTACP